VSKLSSLINGETQTGADQNGQKDEGTEGVINTFIPIATRCFATVPTATRDVGVSTVVGIYQDFLA